MMMELARWSAMVLAFQIVTALGVVSTGCVESSSEILSVPPPVLAVPLPVVDDVVVLAPVAVEVVVRRVGVALAPGPGAAPSAPAPACPGSLNACMITGNTSAAEM